MAAPTKKECGSLVLALLRENHIIFGADRRHTRGDRTANYRDDTGLKTAPILSGYGVVGFAGDDVGERILIPGRNNGLLEGKSLQAAATALHIWARDRYKEYVPDFANISSPPKVDFLLAGFDQSLNGKLTATSYWLFAPDFVPYHAEYPSRKFEIIGRSQHGALYALHRFHDRTQSPDSGLALVCFVLTEVCECDTTVGGTPQLHIIHKGERAIEFKEEQVRPVVEWAKTAALKLGASFQKAPRLRQIRPSRKRV
jgi:20S proteasome alpha/beta subunit